VDIIGDAPGSRYGAALEALLGDQSSDAILIMNCPTAVADSTDAAQAVLEQLRRHKKLPPVLTCWLGARAAAEPRRMFARSGVPSYDTPDEAVRAFMDLVHYHRNQRLLLETPPTSFDAPPNVAEARRMIQIVLDEGRSLLSDPEAKIVLKAYGIPAVESRASISPRAAAEAAAAIGGAVALKILSPDITHKSDAGGVLLNLAPDAVEAAATEMLARVAEKAPDASVTGFVVQSMVVRPHAHELIAGIASDPGFGPVILFGQGGTAVEVIGDRAVGLPPLNPVLAQEVISRTRIARLLAGYRDRPAVDMDAVVAVLVRLSHLATEVEEVSELDINPLIADETGVLALDARIRVQKPAGSGRRRTAIRPYPEELAGDVALPGGESILIRPVRPEDAPSLVELVARSSPEDVRLRFHAGLKGLPHESAARLSQIDYDREMALVGFDRGGAAIGVARFAADPEGETAEFALMVQTDQQNRGIGRTLLARVVEVARGRGLRALWGEVMSVNHEMLTMADAFGFVRSQSEDPAMVRITLGLK
jgi:acetyltransferase